MRPLRFITRRRRRVALVIPLCLVAGSLGVSSPAAASVPDHSRAVAPSAATTTATSARSPNLIAKLLAKLLHRGIRIIRPPAVTVVKNRALDWTRQETINWYCMTWYRYFGYDFDNWRWAATYYLIPRWSWNFCAANWR